VAEYWRLPIWVTQGYRLLLKSAQLAQVLHIARDEDLLASKPPRLPIRPAPLAQPAGQYRIAGQRPGAVGTGRLGQPARCAGNC
jgi:hypothetical protein